MPVLCWGMDYWEVIKTTEEMEAWVNSQSGEIVILAQPPGYDFWNIYDSSGKVVEGRSLGPFRTYDMAKERLKEDISL